MDKQLKDSSLISSLHPKRLIKVRQHVVGLKPIIIAGPCSVESREQLDIIAGAVACNGLELLRGGAFKPRTSPYDFQGLGEEALILLSQASIKFNLPIVSELLAVEHAPMFKKHVDLIQIGARNMQNYALLKTAATLGKPILLKRGFGNSVYEWLMAAEYLAYHGQPDIILCERGSRSFETSSRFSLDLSAALMAQKLSCLPVITDPSHACGHPWMIPKLAIASIAAGLDGVMVEVDHRVTEALCDADQALTLLQLEHMAEEIKSRLK